MSAPPPSALKAMPNPNCSPRHGNGRLAGFTNGFLGGGGGGAPPEALRYVDNGLGKTMLVSTLQPARSAREELRRERRECALH